MSASARTGRAEASIAGEAEGLPAAGVVAGGFAGGIVEHAAASARTLSSERVCSLFMSLLLQEGHAFGHPFRRRRPLEVVIEELEVPDRQVLAIGHASQAMTFARIRQHDRALVVVAK